MTPAAARRRDAPVAAVEVTRLMTAAANGEELFTTQLTLQELPIGPCASLCPPVAAVRLTSPLGSPASRHDPFRLVAGPARPPTITF